MAYNLNLADEALLDIDEIIEWYFTQSPPQRDRCYAHILDCLEEIKLHPTHYGFFAEEYRQAFVKIFPYKILFKVTDWTINVFGVFHLNRNDETVIRRLP